MIVRQIVLLAIAFGAPARADPVATSLAAGMRYGGLHDGSDRYDLLGGDVAAERSLSRHLSWRVALAVDTVHFRTDAGGDWDGYQVLGLAGIRLDAAAHDEASVVRPYLASALGAGFRHENLIATMPPTANHVRAYLQLLQGGVDVSIDVYLIRASAGVESFLTDNAGSAAFVASVAFGRQL